MNDIKAVAAADDLIRSLVQNELMRPSELFSGIHNAFVHGELLEFIGYEPTEKETEKILKHLVKINCILNQIETR